MAPASARGRAPGPTGTGPVVPSPAYSEEKHLKQDPALG